jgi:hypothetical protein
VVSCSGTSTYIHTTSRGPAVPPLSRTHQRFAPPIHSQLFYSIVKSFYANMSWPLKFNNIPDPGTEPQRSNDSPIPIDTLYRWSFQWHCRRNRHRHASAFNIATTYITVPFQFCNTLALCHATKLVMGVSAWATATCSLDDMALLYMLEYYLLCMAVVGVRNRVQQWYVD